MNEETVKKILSLFKTTDDWDTAIKQICQLELYLDSPLHLDKLSKPDDRLLTDEDIKEFITDHGWILSPAKMLDMISQFKEFASIKDAEWTEKLDNHSARLTNVIERDMRAECIKKIEEIFREMGKLITQLISQGFLPSEYHSFLTSRFQTLKDKYKKEKK